MTKVQIFASFDVEHDGELYERLLAQSEDPGSSFSVVGGSTPPSATDFCSEKVRRRIREADQVIVICGEHTEASMHVSSELRMAREERKPYFLLWGRREIMCTKPIGARSDEGMYSWTRQIVEDQIALTLRVARADTPTKNAANATRKGE